MTHPDSGLQRCQKISTRTPLAGRDTDVVVDDFDFCEFLLTRPSRGVTGGKDIVLVPEKFLLTRPSRGVTPLPFI